MNRFPVATFGQRAKAEPLKQRLREAGIYAEINDELLKKLWLHSPEPAVFVRVEVPEDSFERACQLLRQWDTPDGVLREAIRCPECRSLRVAYPQFTRKFFLPNLAMGLFARLGLMEKLYYCEECQCTWPREGTLPRRNRPHMAPYYFIEGVEQTTLAEPGPAQAEAKRKAA